MGETYSRQPRAAPNFLLWAAKWWSSFGILFSRKKTGNQNQHFSERFPCCSGREEEEFPAKTHSVFIFLSKKILQSLSSWPCSFCGNSKIVSARFFERSCSSNTCQSCKKKIARPPEISFQRRSFLICSPVSSSFLFCRCSSVASGEDGGGGRRRRVGGGL